MQPLLVVPASDIHTSGTSLVVELPAPWLTAQTADADASADGPGQFKARLSRSGRADVVVTAKVSAHVRLPCARCLGPVPIVIDTDLALLLTPRAGGSEGGPRQATKSSAGRSVGLDKASAAPAKTGQAKVPHDKERAGQQKDRAGSTKGKRRAPPGEYEFSSAEADEDTYDGERVVLDGFVREAILLELPSFPLCSEACTGIEEPKSLSDSHPHGRELPLLRALSGGGPSRQDGRSQGNAAPNPSPSRPGGGKPNPFEALRYLLQGEGAGEAPRRPSPAEVRRAARATKRGKPRLKSSMASRTKK